jgi:hypothetical protein
LFGKQDFGQAEWNEQNDESEQNDENNGVHGGSFVYKSMEKVKKRRAGQKLVPVFLTFIKTPGACIVTLQNSKARPIPLRGRVSLFVGRD